MKTLKTTLSVLLIMISLSSFAQPANFDTKLISKNSYHPGTTCELVFAIVTPPGVTNQYEWAQLYYLELQFPFGMEPISSADEYIINENISQNGISNYMISWGDINLYSNAVFYGEQTFSVNVICHELLSNLQAIEVKMGLSYYEHNEYIDTVTSYVPMYSPIDIKVNSVGINAQKQISIGILNIGDDAVSSVSIDYSIDNGETITYNQDINLDAAGYVSILLPSENILPPTGNAYLDIEINTDGDISPNNNIYQGIKSISSSALFANNYVLGSEMGYSFPSFRLSSHDEGSDRFISADDFSVPVGQNWNIRQIQAYAFVLTDTLPDRFAIEIFMDDNGQPGDTYYYEECNTIKNSKVGNMCFNFDDNINISSGDYWLSIYGIFDNVVDANQNQWRWRYTDYSASDNTFMYKASIDYASFPIQDWEEYYGDELSLNFKIFGEIATGITNIEDNFNLEVYPNPATDFLNISTETLVSYVIYDLAGRCILNNNKSKGKIDISSLADGKYILKIVLEQQVVTKQFVKI